MLPKLSNINCLCNKQRPLVHEEGSTLPADSFRLLGPSQSTEK